MAKDVNSIACERARAHEREGTAGGVDVYEDERLGWMATIMKMTTTTAAAVMAAVAA